jgi:hypothetical protein
MAAKVRQRTMRGVHAKIAAEELRTGNRIGLLVLVIVFVVLVAILLRLANFSSRGSGHRAPPPHPAAMSHVVRKALTTFVT